MLVAAQLGAQRFGFRAKSFIVLSSII